MKKLLYILLFLPALAHSQIIGRAKSFQYIGTTGIAQYSGTTAQRPTGDLRFGRWNTDSNRYEIKINSTTWRGLLFNGEGGGGGGSGTVTSVSGTSNRISVATGTTTPVIDIDAAYIGQTSITTLGTIGTGTWNATTIGLTKGGTGQTTANASFNALAPSQTSNSGKYLTTDGSNTSWATITAITASDTAAITSRAWRTNGNNMAAVTGRLGTTSNDHVDVITNNTPIGRFSASGQFIWGATSSLSANYGVQLRKPTVIFASPTGQMEFMVDDDGFNASNFTFPLSVSGTNNRGLGVMVLSNNAISVRKYGAGTDLFTIGADGGSTNPGAPLTHLYAETATTGRKYAYGAYNTVTSASGDFKRYAFEDSSVLNHSGGTGTYGSFYAHPSITASLSQDFAFRNDVLNNLFNQTSGITSIGTSSTNGHLNVGGNRTFTSNYPGAQFASATYTDNTTSASSTSTQWLIHAFNAPTIAATNSSVSVPGATNVYIGKPIAGTNVSFQSKYALFVDGPLLTNEGLIRKLSALSSNTTLDDSYDLVLANANGGAFNITLPTSAGKSGTVYTIKKTDASVNAVTVNTTSSQTIDGSTTYSLALQNKYVIIASDGSNWFIIGNN